MMKKTIQKNKQDEMIIDNVCSCGKHFKSKSKTGKKRNYCDDCIRKRRKYYNKQYNKQYNKEQVVLSENKVVNRIEYCPKCNTKLKHGVDTGITWCPIHGCDFVIKC